MENNKYTIISDVIGFKLYTGELTLEEANKLNDIFYDKYCAEITEESVKAEIGKKLRELPDKIDLVKKWGIKKNETKNIDRDDVSDKDYETIVSSINAMLKSNIYSAYKIHFDKLARVLGIKPSVIISYKYKKGTEKDKNHVSIRYEEKNKKVTIPNGYDLYHISPCSTIKELEPKFKGKAPRCYFYDTPRVYCSIRRDMAKGYAQFKGSQANVGLTKYKICEKIRTAVLDDRIGNIKSGAVYIETRFPIKVKKVDN